ncbi:MAG: CdaR family protein [Dehalococcoidia bacterium]
MERVIGWLRTALATTGFIARQGAGSLRDNWGVGILSVVLAVSLWIYVTDREDPEVTARVAGSIPVQCVNAPAGRAVSPPCLETESVAVRVRAPESVLEELTAQDFEARADLSGVTTDETTVTVRVESTRSRVEIVEVLPPEITVTLEDVTARTVPVQTRMVGTPPPGYEVDQVTLEPGEAVVTGPASLVELVAAVEADVNLTGVRTDFEQTLLLQARDELGANIEGVVVEPESVLVQVELAQVQFSAIFVVLPDVTGTPALGFRVAGIEVDPPLVVVSGPSEVFQTLEPAGGVTTVPVPIDDASTDVQRTVALLLPEDASVEQATVTVRVIIEAIDGATP